VPAQLEARLRPAAPRAADTSALAAEIARLLHDEADLRGIDG
jgi:hypothetical protein